MRISFEIAVERDGYYKLTIQRYGKKTRENIQGESSAQSTAPSRPTSATALMRPVQHSTSSAFIFFSFSLRE